MKSMLLNFLKQYVELLDIKTYWARWTNIEPKHVYLIKCFTLFILLWVSKKYYGSVIIPIVLLYLFWVIAKRMCLIELMLKKIRLASVLKENSSWYRRIISWQFFIKTTSVVMAFFISLSFMIFINTVGWIFHIVLLFDALAIWFISQKISMTFVDDIKESVLNFAKEVCVNTINVIVLFLIYVAYSLWIEPYYETNFVSTMPGMLDPEIPLWIKDNVKHSCNYFAILLRCNVLMTMTFKNIASFDSSVYLLYKIFHLLTMSFWPFLGITLVYRHLLGPGYINFSETAGDCENV